MRCREDVWLCMCGSVCVVLIKIICPFCSPFLVMIIIIIIIIERKTRKVIEPLEDISPRQEYHHCKNDCLTRTSFLPFLIRSLQGKCEDKNTLRMDAFIRQNRTVVDNMCCNI